MMKRKEITQPIVQAAVIVAIFYALEIAMVYLDVFPNNTQLLIADIALRIACGTAGLLLLKRHADRAESKYTVRQLFTNRIPAKTWLVLIPFFIYILSPFLNLCIAKEFTTEYVSALSIVLVQQFAVGYCEEGVQRGLMMNGLILHNTGTVRQRIATVAITGLFFGLGHVPNIAFGENPLIQMPSSLLWGMFIAAVYLLSDNLLLVMLLHALSDMTPRIVNYLYYYDREAALCRAVGLARDALDYVILPLAAIWICVNYEKWKKS